MKQYVEAGRIVNTHGINGEVKIEVWLDSPQFFKRFRRLYTADGTEWGVVSARAHKGFVIAKLAGVDITTDGPLNATVDYIGSIIDEICELTEEIDGIKL